MTTKPFFVKIPSDLLARKDLTMTRKVILAYFKTRAGTKWQVDRTDLIDNLGLPDRTVKRELKALLKEGIIKCLGYSHRWQKHYKKYVLTEQAKTVPIEGAKMAPTEQAKMSTSNSTEDRGTEDRDNHSTQCTNSGEFDLPQEVQKMLNDCRTRKVSQR